MGSKKMISVEAGQLALDLGIDQACGLATAPACAAARRLPVESPPPAPLVAVIDDDEGARRSTAWLLESQGYRVVTFTSGDAFLGARLPADLACALLDLRMPGRNGIDVLRALRQRDDAPPVLVLTGHGDLATAIDAMKLKAADFLEKPYPADRLLEALRSASLQGEQSRAAQARRRDAQTKLHGLSERQRQVLAGVVRGQASKVIAWELGLSVRTVEAYRAQLLSRLGVRRSAEAVRIAVAAGLETAQPHGLAA